MPIDARPIHTVTKTPKNPRKFRDFTFKKTGPDLYPCTKDNSSRDQLITQRENNTLWFSHLLATVATIQRQLSFKISVISMALVIRNQLGAHNCEWTRLRVLAEKAKLGRTAASDALKFLENLGWIIKVQTSHKGGNGILFIYPSTPSSYDLNKPLKGHRFNNHISVPAEASSFFAIANSRVGWGGPGSEQGGGPGSESENKQEIKEQEKLHQQQYEQRTDARETAAFAAERVFEEDSGERLVQSIEGDTAELRTAADRLPAGPSFSPLPAEGLQRRTPPTPTSHSPRSADLPVREGSGAEVDIPEHLQELDQGWKKTLLPLVSKLEKQGFKCGTKGRMFEVFEANRHRSWVLLNALDVLIARVLNSHYNGEKVGSLAGLFRCILGAIGRGEHGHYRATLQSIAQRADGYVQHRGKSMISPGLAAELEERTQGSANERGARPETPQEASIAEAPEEKVASNSPEPTLAKPGRAEQAGKAAQKIRQALGSGRKHQLLRAAPLLAGLLGRRELPALLQVEVHNHDSARGFCEAIYRAGLLPGEVVRALEGFGVFLGDAGEEPR